jgi:hypothetical protein
MAEDRQIRKLLNTKQDIIEFKGIPSKDSISEGQVAFAKDPTGRLTLFRKSYGKLWKTYMTYDGDQVVDRNLKVGGSLTVKGNLKGTRAYFGAGEATAFNSNQYLETFNSVRMSDSQGYRMLRSGSLVGMSASYNVTNIGSSAQVLISVRSGTSNLLTFNSGITGTGIKSVSMVQARYVDKFDLGDMLTMRAAFTNEAGSNATIDDVIAYFEVVFND